MNYKDYYARQAGGALPYFAGAPYQRGHGLGSLFGGLLRSAMPLIKRGAVALGKGALKIGVRIADDVLSGQSIKRAAKRHVTDSGKTMLRDILILGVRPRKRIKHTSVKKGGTTATRQRKRQTFKKREADIFDDDDDYDFRIKTVVRGSQELDLFTVPPTQNSIVDSRIVEHQPMASLDSGGPIEFLIPGSGDDYLDLSNTMLHVQVKLTRADGDDLLLALPVGPVNNWLHSLFSQVDVYPNGTLVTPSTNTYAYRAYIETLLTQGSWLDERTSYGVGS